MRPSSEPSPAAFAKGPVTGAIFGLLIVLSPILFSARGSLAFFSLVGLVIVLGGVVATAFMSFPAADVHQALRAIPSLLKSPRADRLDLNRDMNGLLVWARAIKTGGLGGLRASLEADSVTNPFVNYGLNMVLSEYRPDEVRAMLETAADAGYDRDCVPVDVLRAMTSHAPAFGMVGTLIGMIAMLCEMNDNVASTGSTLAVAFLSTLYGVVSARMVYMPAAARLQQEIDGRQRRHGLITEGMVMLARGETPSRMQDRLNGFLGPGQHDYFDAIASTGEPGFVTLPAAARAGREPNPRRPRSDFAAALSL